ncbi:unnamed protein product [Thelazia callipaeda]|uniref:UDP-glucuronosyltransferase n=1 Tax=Thelazia callipaeda TaxID=103827 RepID=A0A0N5CPI9_THECL|nr:unnamed protein product [Thelazia callipaeda]
MCNFNVTVNDLIMTKLVFLLVASQLQAKYKTISDDMLLPIIHVVLTSTVICTLGAKILVYSPRIEYSHVNFMGRMADILVQAGHNVVISVVVVSDLNSNVHNNEQLADENFIENLREEKFDLGITELISFCSYALFRKLEIKAYISSYSLNLMEVISDPLGVSSNPSYVPVSVSKNSDEMTYLERLDNFLHYIAIYCMSRYFAITIASSLNKDHSISQSHEILQMAIKNSSFALINSEELLEYPRLMSQKVVFIGGIAVNKPKNLDQFYGQLMNESVNGAVLISFGANARSKYMSQAGKECFERTFESFPEILFIWKYEGNDSVANNIPNVVKMEWVPQNDLLGHKNLRVLISHCGQNSIMEAVHAGVPIICIPLLADQTRNAKALEKRQIAIVIKKKDLNAISLQSALRRILYNKKFGDNSRRLAEMIREKPISARDRFLNSINFVLKFHGVHNLDISSANLNFLQYYLLDLVFPFILLIALSAYLVLRVLIKSISFSARKKDKSD